MCFWEPKSSLGQNKKGPIKGNYILYFNISTATHSDAIHNLRHKAVECITCPSPLPITYISVSTPTYQNKAFFRYLTRSRGNWYIPSRLCLVTITTHSSDTATRIPVKLFSVSYSINFITGILGVRARKSGMAPQYWLEEGLGMMYLRMHVGRH